MSARLTLSTGAGPDGRLAVSAVGEIDLSNIARFESAVQEAIAQAGPAGAVVVDLAGVEYLDSAAINVLFAHSGSIGRVVVHPLMLHGLQVSGLDQVVELRPAGPGAG